MISLLLNAMAACLCCAILVVDCLSLVAEEVRQAAVQLKQLATDYSHKNIRRGLIIIAQSKANCLSCTAPVRQTHNCASDVFGN